jgi:hypothetical protein
MPEDADDDSYEDSGECGPLVIVSGTVADMMTAKRALYEIAGEEETDIDNLVLGTAGMCRKARPLDREGIPNEMKARAEELEGEHPKQKCGFLIGETFMLETAQAIALQMRWTPLPRQARTVLSSLVEVLSGGRVRCPAKVIPRDTRQTDGSKPSISRGVTFKSKSDAPIHIFVARSRRIEIKNGKVVFYRKAEPCYRSAFETGHDEPAFPFARSAVHVVAIDTAGWGWDGIVLGPDGQTDLNDRIAYWVEHAQKLFGRNLTKEDFIFAEHGSDLFDRQIAGHGEERSKHFTDPDQSPWGRMLEWEHILVCLTRISPFFHDFKSASEGMRMLGPLWADQIGKMQPLPVIDWASANEGVINFGINSSRAEDISEFGDKVLDALAPIYMSIAQSRIETSADPTWDESRFRARKRIPNAIIGTLDLSEFKITERHQPAKATDRIPVAIERVHGGGSHLCASQWEISFRHKRSVQTVPVFRAFTIGTRYDGREYGSPGLFFVFNKDIGRNLSALYSPETTSKAAGLSCVPDFLDRLVAAAVRPLGVADALFGKSGAIALATRDPYFWGDSIVQGALTDAVANAGFEVAGIADNKGEPGVCVSISHISLSEKGGKVNVPAGFVRFPIAAGTADWSGTFCGFSRCLSLADELLLKVVSDHGPRVASWFSEKGRQKITTKGRAVASGCAVNDLLKRDGKRTWKSGVRFCESEEASAYFN